MTSLLAFCPTSSEESRQEEQRTDFFTFFPEEHTPIIPPQSEK
jgi:hypothetical protein